MKSKSLIVFKAINQSSIFITIHIQSQKHEYRWEKVTALFIDGPALKLQWARSEFGNILACSGYNKCVNIFKEEKLGNNINWKCSAQIKEFTHSVEDITFLPEKHSLVSPIKKAMKTEVIRDNTSHSKNNPNE